MVNMFFIKRVLVIVWVCMFTGSLWSTPDPAEKERQLLLGVAKDQQSYYVLSMRFSQPGSHYISNNKYLLIHYSFSGEIIEQREFYSVTRTAVYDQLSDSMEVTEKIESDQGVFKHDGAVKNDSKEIEMVGFLNLFERIDGVAFPEKISSRFSLQANRLGIYIVVEGDRVYLVDKKWNKEVIRDLFDRSDLRVLNSYYTKEYILFEIQSGDGCCDDTDFYQGFFAVERKFIETRIREAEKRFKVGISP